MSEGAAPEEEEEENRSSLDVNLLTLTFGTQPEDKLVFCSSEDPVSSDPPAPAGTLWLEGGSDYVCRPPIRDLHAFL